MALVVLTGACGYGDEDKEVRFTSATAPSQSLVGSLPAGFPGDDVEVKNTFVGLAGEASKIGVAFVRRGDEVAVYLCDGQTISDWFAGKLDGDRLRLQSAEGTKLDATLKKSGVSGTITVNGQAVAFNAPPAVPGETGISIRKLPEGSQRWILTQEGIYGAFEDSGGKTVSTTSSTSSSGTTSGSGTSSTPPPSQPVSNPCAGTACDGLSCGDLTSLHGSYLNGMRLAKTKQLKELYFDGAEAIALYAITHGCKVG